ncbi:diaminopropionate ammonia-lyase [Bacilli bacterium PM5-9]|nr:diaminopropionate ammonia-lyase [Bacilli bacterium PM5-9]
MINKDFRSVVNKNLDKKYNIDFLSLETARKIVNFHQSFPVYQKTPLWHLDDLAKDLNVEKVYVKDESYRFDLNAFKVLGGSYAIGQVIAQKAGLDADNISFEALKDAKAKLGDLTFVTATDGNHGRGLAWSANQLEYKSVVYMPKGSAIERRDNIKAENSECTITDMNYDDAVRLANQMAQEKGWVMVQDTAWEGYEEIPTWIMQGYMSLAYEIYDELNKEKDKRPTHIFLQAGVGSLAAAICGFFANVYQDNLVKIIVVEPSTVDCIYQTAKANDGKLHNVTGDLDTIMAGLACGEPNPIGWNVLNSYAYSFVTCPDYAAADGMRVLANPLGNDNKIVSGESGAAPFGCVINVIKDNDLVALKEEMGIDEKSRLLFINSEGDTDKENYRNVVWYGKYSKFEK